MSEGPLVPILIFVIGLGLLVTSFVLSIRAIKDPVYKIIPRNCDASIFANTSSYRTGTWYLLYRWGACPLDARTLETQVTRTYSTNYHTSRTISVDYWYYHDCIYNSTQWRQIDEMNRSLGYNTRLEADSWDWFHAWICSIAAVIILYLIIIPIIIAICSENPGIYIVVGVILFIFSILWSTVVWLVSITQQTDPRAWSTWFFQSCDVHIERSTGYTFAVMCAVFSGVLFLFPAVYLLFSRSNYWTHLRSVSQDHYEKILEDASASSVAHTDDEGRHDHIHIHENVHEQEQEGLIARGSPKINRPKMAPATGIYH